MAHKCKNVNCSETKCDCDYFRYYNGFKSKQNCDGCTACQMEVEMNKELRREAKRQELVEGE